MMFYLRPVWLLALSASGCGVGARAGEPMVGEIYEQAPLRYSRREPTDEIHEWQRTLVSGKPSFDESSEKAFLRSVLTELDVPWESQVLVFSHTSLQNSRISPATPRAIYFNENTYVGWVQGGEVELITTDRQLGMTFYRLKSAALSKQGRPVVERDNSCLICHASGPENPFPGLRAFSVFVNDEGAQVLRGKSLDVDYRTPIEERWGGWYVSGDMLGPQHRGNLFVGAQGNERIATAPSVSRERPKVLDGFFDTAPYLTNKSDVATLMVFEHQIAAHNRLIAAHGRARIAMYRDEEHMAGGAVSDSTRDVLRKEVEGLLDVILFKDEAPLASHRLGADEEFARAFARSARRDARGRSLRDLRLNGTLFRYRCSYMVYSSAFERLPEDVRALFWTRLEEVLNEPAGTGAYPYIRDEERRAIREILAETHHLAPESWRAAR